MGTARYQMEHTNTDTIGGRLLYISHSKYENDWPSLLHTHPFSELFMVKSGRGSVQIEDAEYPVCKDDFVIINADVPHTEKSSADMPLEYVTIGVEDLRFSFDGEKEHTIFSSGTQQGSLLFYMNTMLHEMKEKNTDYENICRNLLEVLLITLIRRIHFTFAAAPSSQVSGECLKLKRYIESNYVHELTLDTLAEFTHLNKFYLVHAFTRHCGCSPIQYLCQVRIQASRELLANTDYSIAQVAQSSGFSSQSYFAQCFQKSCGMTASAYRKSHRNCGQ